MPAINIMYTNADQFTTMKMSELLEFVEQKKPHIIAICEVKPKIPRERKELDYVIPDYSLHPVNIDPNIRGVIIIFLFILRLITIQINPGIKFSEVCLLEIRLCGGVIYSLVATTSTPEKNNANLNSLLKYSSGKKYSQQCLVGDFNFNNINWFTWTTPHNEESKEAQFIETISDYYHYQHLLEPIGCRSTDNPSLIDLVLTNEVMQVSDIEYHPPIGMSDHCVISLNTFKYYCYFDYFQPKERYVYHRTDFNSTRKQLTGQKYS